MQFTTVTCVLTFQIIFKNCRRIKKLTSDLIYFLFSNFQVPHSKRKRSEKKLNNNEMEAATNVELLDLPLHILHKIVNYCDIKDVLNLTQTCTQLNEIIFNPKYTTSDRILLVPQETLGGKLRLPSGKTGRKYKNITVGTKIKFNDHTTLNKFMNTNGPHLKYLDICFLSVRSNTYQMLLKKCSKLDLLSLHAKEETVFETMSLSKQFRLDVPVKLERLEIDVIFFVTMERRFLINYNKLRCLHITCNDRKTIITRETSENISWFVSIQLQLETLWLDFKTDSRSELFADITCLQNCKFKLQELKLINCLFDKKNVNEFFSKQGRSLNTLSLINISHNETFFNDTKTVRELWRSTLHLKKLISLQTKMSLGTNNLDIIGKHTFHTVEHLQITEENISYVELLKSFPCLLSLEIEYPYDDSVYDEEDIETLAINIPPNILQIVTLLNTGIFFYAPESLTTNNKLVEWDLLNNFFKRHPQLWYIKTNIRLHK